jgi:hypothetical protein
MAARTRTRDLRTRTREPWRPKNRPFGDDRIRPDLLAFAQQCAILHNGGKTQVLIALQNQQDSDPLAFFVRCAWSAYPSGKREAPMVERLCYSVREICQLTGFGRKRILDDMTSGKLKARKRGRKWFAMTDDLFAYLHGHPGGANGGDNPLGPVAP